MMVCWLIDIPLLLNKSLLYCFPMVNVYTKIWEEKNLGTSSFQDYIIKGSIRCELISADFDAVSEIGYFIDDVSR